MFCASAAFEKRMVATTVAAMKLSNFIFEKLNGEQKKGIETGRFRVGALRAARRFNHSYFGWKPDGKMDGGGYFVQKIPVRLALFFDKKRADAQLKTGRDGLKMWRGRRAWTAVFAAMAGAAVLFLFGWGRFLCAAGLLLFRSLLFAEIPAAGNYGGRRCCRKGEQQRELEQNGGQEFHAFRKRRVDSFVFEKNKEQSCG